LGVSNFKDIQMCSGWWGRLQNWFEKHCLW